MSGSGQVCKFFLEGRCKFGAQCKFRHPSGGAGGGGGGWNRRGGGGGGGGRHQGDPVDSGRRWDQRGGNRFQLFSDGGGGGGGGGSYSGGRGWNDRGQTQWRGGGRGGARGGWRGGGWGGGGNTRQSSNYQNQRYQNDQYYQNNRYSGDRFQQNWSTRGRGGLFSDNQRSSNYQNSYQRVGRYGPASTSYDSHHHQASETVQLSDPRDIAAQIRVDMEEWNKSGMWPLSCYAYFRETSCLPGFADVSPEELRWEAYRAKASGNSQQYLKNVGQLNDERLKVMHEFSNLTKDDVRDMLSGLKSTTGGANSSSQNFFAPSTTGTTTSSLFGNTTPSSSLFGSQRQSSLFASSPPPPTTTTIAQQQAMQKTAGSLFGDTSAQEMLTKPMPTTAGVAKQQQLNQPSQSQPSTLTPGNSGVVAGGSTKLTDKELEAFKADKFILGQIPEHAPPEVLCN